MGGRRSSHADEQNAEPPEETIHDTATKRNGLNLKVSEDGTTLSGDISVYCPGVDTQACTSVAKSMSQINQTIDGKTLRLNVTATRWKIFADIEVFWRDFADPTLQGQQLYNKIELKYGLGFGTQINSLTPAHELGHFIGLEHQSNNTTSLMSYSSLQTSSVTKVQMENLFKAYGK